MTQPNDIFSETLTREPPGRLFDKLKFLGPGFILSASIVGSGELIATTVLGAKAGFAALWIIIVSCLIKVTVQLEFGRNAILTGRTAMESFNQLPGPRIGKCQLSVWMIFLLQTLKIVQLGGMLGGTSLVLYMIYPGIPFAGWAVLTCIFVSILIYNGRYSWAEKISLVLVAGFTVFTMVAVFSLRYTEYSFSFMEMINGLRFRLSGEVAAVAIGAFGITGVASDEIIAYNYWCLEKGYAVYTGPRKNTSEWLNRAKGWISVMYLDAIIAMIIYTLVTVAFYLLGAAILHSQSIVPEGNRVIETVALIYTQSLGPGIKTLYLIGAFFVLFSSLFATLAAWTRVFPDVFYTLGWGNLSERKRKQKLIRWLTWLFPITWALALWLLQSPVLMVLSGGVVGSVMLLVVATAAIYFKRHTSSIISTSAFYHIAFWISAVTILSVAVYGLVQVL
jgi:Mn2+/Fe2+ NRAMP family transporter